MNDDLSPGDAHVWLVKPETAANARLARGYERIISADERAQRERLRSPEHRHDFLVTRALVRTTLSRYETVSPETWRFASNAHGRPELAGPDANTGLKFNVSHTRGLIACIVARHHDVGVDVEWTGREGRLLELSDRYFSADEAKRLRDLPQDAQRDRFFQYWTLKESFIKAVGVGVAFGLSRFSFDLDQDPIRVAFEAGVSEDPACWQFTQHRPTFEHLLATSVRREPGQSASVLIRETVPLVDGS